MMRGATTGTRTTCTWRDESWASHYFTDLTQPMHAANFTNGFSFEGNGGAPNKDDRRHARFEDLADHILLVTDQDRGALIADPAAAAPAFADTLEPLVKETATFAKGVFDQYVAPLMRKLGEQGRLNVPLEPAEGLPALSRSFPAGQLATAKLFQQWARQSHDGSPSKRLRSDWVSVSLRPDGNGALQPCLFYRRDGDLALVFRFFDGTQWREDTEPFASTFGNTRTDGALAFATAFDRSTNHPAVFVPEPDPRYDVLWYFDHGVNGWKVEAISLLRESRVRGAIVAVYDQRYGKPSALYRGANGALHYVYWSGTRFVVHALDAPKVGGAIAAVWDPTDAGRGDGKGHVTATYVTGNGMLAHLDVRNGAWRHTSIVPPKPNTHANADSLALATIHDAEASAVGVFWGLVSYTRERVPESDPWLYTRVASFPQLMYTTVQGGNQVTIQLEDRVTGRIAATAKGGVAAHYRLPDDAGRVVCERRDGKWVVTRHRISIASMIAAGEGPDGTNAIGWRESNRFCDAIRYPAAD
jgi:hypothetical protein